MRIVRAADYRRMPWKNGGGVTTEIWAEPEGSTLSSFDWRISMANVATDGPFSIFPEIDRTLALLEGTAIELQITGRGTVLVDASSQPVSFPGDVEVSGRLPDGPILDLNVMTRRGRATHSLERLMPLPGAMLSRVAPFELLLAHGGDVALSCGDFDIRLATEDAVVLDERAPSCRVLILSEMGKLFRAAIWPLSDKNSGGSQKG